MLDGNCAPKGKPPPEKEMGKTLEETCPLYGKGMERIDFEKLISILYFLSQVFFRKIIFLYHLTFSIATTH